MGEQYFLAYPIYFRNKTGGIRSGVSPKLSLRRFARGKSSPSETIFAEEGLETVLYLLVSYLDLAFFLLLFFFLPLDWNESKD